MGTMRTPNVLHFCRSVFHRLGDSKFSSLDLPFYPSVTFHYYRPYDDGLDIRR